MTERRAPVTAPELLLKLVLTGTQSHYETRGIIDDKRLEHLLHAGKQILYKSHQECDVRQNLGFSPNVWQGLTDVLGRAIPVLERQSFAWKNAPADSYNGSSSDLIAANYFNLVKDIERLNDLCTIARNLLATTKKAQNLAAEKGFDQQILKLIDVCVRVTARGFDGETNVRNEERWQKVVNLYKRLLITCLQFLHNFIMHNEHRKLVLWLDLFGNASTTQQQQQQAQLDAVQDQVNMERKLSGQRQSGEGSANSVPGGGDDDINKSGKTHVEGQTSTSGIGQGYNIDDVHALFELMRTENPPQGRTQAAAKILMDKIRSDMERISGLNANQLDDNPEALLKVGAALRAQLPVKSVDKSISGNTSAAVGMKGNIASAQSSKQSDHWSGLQHLASYGNATTAEQDITEDDLVMPRTSQSAAETLQEAKDELMARLQDNAPILDENGEQIYDEDPVPENALEDDILDSAEDSVEDEEEDDEDYRSPGDQERGLLTDVPLVLGPTEIEALPMIIQAGIVDNFGAKNGADRQGVRNMQAVRCHILLAQEAGRNVLRELLIFIAAWDLPDDEFYFKMMVQIMEAILKNGLMSHAYSDFGQAKDIISPAQAVVIKILTHIFRAKYSPSSIVGANGKEQVPPKPRLPAPLSRVDVLTVRYIFTVFRGNIIPETCALIYLQGQIRAGLAMAEDFPLNLWDMERVYEGVYQFLEFFAVLTENNDWKRLLVEWEIVYDLVTLIKELDASIPKATLTSTMPPPVRPVQAQPTKSTSRTTSDINTIPLAVERPYDPLTSPQPAPVTTANAKPSQSTPSQTPSAKPPPPDFLPSATAQDSTTTEDPSLFEWRNLKKLIVLVLSSLVWKSPIVQTQIRNYEGVETILSCTNYDGHNPYIKEHAVMCLKFLLEGSKENQEIIRSLEARGITNNSSTNGSDGPAGSSDGGMLEGFGLKAELGENGRVRVVRDATLRKPPSSMSSGRPMRRASEGAHNPSMYSSMGRDLAGLRDRFGRVDLQAGPSRMANPVGAHTRTMGRVIDEDEEEDEEEDDDDEDDEEDDEDGEFDEDEEDDESEPDDELDELDRARVKDVGDML